MPDIAEQIKKLGLPPAVESAVSLAAAAGIGAAVGGGAGAASAYNVDLNNRQLHQVDRNNAKRLAALAKEKGLNYSEQDILAMLQRSGVVDEKGNVLVPADTQEIYVNGLPLKNGSATLPLTDNQIQNPPFAVRTDGTASIEILPNVNNPEVADFIAKNSTGYYFSPAVLPAPNTAASAALPPAPAGTRRVPVVVDGVAYFPLVANCPAASCAGGDPIAGALGDASTQAYLDAVNRKSEKDLNIATSAAGILGAALRGIKAIGSLVDAALAERVIPPLSYGANSAVVNAGFDTTNLQSKLEGYLLDVTHAQNQTKATWFQQALGFDQSNWQQLASQITFNESTAVATKVTQYGQTFEQVLPISGANGNTANVTFVFMKDNTGTVRLVTGIPTKK